MQSLAHQLQAFRTIRSFVKMHLPLQEAAETLAQMQGGYRVQWTRIRDAVASGAKLSETLAREKLWPDPAIRAIQNAEKAGEPAGVMKVFDTLIQMTADRIRVRSTASKELIGPVFYLYAGFSLLYFTFGKLWPILTGALEAKKRKGFVLIFDSLSQSALVVMPIVIGVAIGIVVMIAVMYQTHGGRNLVFSALSRIPVVGTGLLQTSLGYWCRSYDLIDQAGDVAEDLAIEMAADVLPDVHKASFSRLVKEYRDSGSLLIASRRQNWRDGDPRLHWPVLFSAGLYSAATSGTLGDTARDLAPEMLDSGLTKMQTGIGAFSLIAKMITYAAGGMAMLMMGLGNLAQVMARMH